jgi:hypothetical protein
MDTTINSQRAPEVTLNQTVNSDTTMLGLTTQLTQGKKKQKLLSFTKLQRDINRDFKRQYEEYLLQQVVLQGDVPNFFYHGDKFAFAKNS